MTNEYDGGFFQEQLKGIMDHFEDYLKNYLDLLGYVKFEFNQTLSFHEKSGYIKTMMNRFTRYNDVDIESDIWYQNPVVVYNYMEILKGMIGVFEKYFYLKHSNQEIFDFIAKDETKACVNIFSESAEKMIETIYEKMLTFLEKPRSSIIRTPDDILQKWKDVAEALASELHEANKKLNPLFWEFCDEESPAMIQYDQLLESEKK